MPTLQIIEELVAVPPDGGLAPAQRLKLLAVKSEIGTSIATMRAAGVKIGSGSDIVGPVQSNRGREIVLNGALVGNRQVILRATRVNAELFGLTDRIGTVEAGKDADLLRINGQPLDDIAVLGEPARIRVVLKNGEVVKDTERALGVAVAGWATSAGMIDPSIHTVRGPVQPDLLGRCLPHEHVFCDFYRVTRDLNHLLNDEALATTELTRLVAAGGRAVVDCTTIDAGRDPTRLLRVSEATGLHIVMSTGWYRQSYYPPEIDLTPTDELAALMIRELLEGVEGTGIRAGVIAEIGVDRDRPTAAEERVLRAAARAQRRTGAPLITHASLFPAGIPQLDLLDEEGVDPARVVIGHADTYLDPDYHRAVLRRGAWLAFDTVAREHMNPDARRVEALVRLIDEGWEDRLLLSSDRCFRSDLCAFGGPGYGVVFTDFVPALRDAGVPDTALDRMTVENPGRFLAW